MSDRKSHLEENVDNDHQHREGQVKEEPDFHRLDVGGAGEAGGDGQVDRGQHHHAGHVDGVDQLGVDQLVFKIVLHVKL